jgi:RNA recognition motif-containing protein
MRNKEDGKSRGFGFVTFACSFMAEAAMEHKEPHVINGKEIAPKFATPDIPRYKQSIPEMEAPLDDECRNKRSIFVGALKDTITEEILVNYFSGFGKVIRAIINTERETGEKKTFGFVDFAEYGVVRKVMNVTKHFIQGKRIRVELSRPRIEFSHQTKTVFVGGLEDGIDDPELYKYFSEFGFVVRALRIPNKDEPKRKFGFVDFDDYDAVDIVVSQRDHFIEGHRVRVELALPLVNDSLYEKDVIVPGETWLEKVQRKLQYAIPDQGTWGETMNNYEVFVQGGDVKTIQFKILRGMLEYVVGMAGKVVEEIANDSNTRIVLTKPAAGAKHVVFTITGKHKDVDLAQYIFKKIVKANIHKLNMVRPITNS